MTTVRGSLVRTAVFTVLYVLAAFAGRMTVMDGTNLSMVWPAAGVLAVWFCAQRKATVRWADVAAVIAVTFAVNLATGASERLAVVFVLANLAQIGVFVWLVGRWHPSLWGAGGSERLARPRDLWALLGAAAASTGLGAGIGTTGMWLISGHFSWPALAVWLARNTASVLLIGAVGLRIGHTWHTRPPGTNLRTLARRALAVWRATPGWRVAEYTALLICSAVAYWFGFAAVSGIPLAFALIAVTVWAALRTPTTFVVIHDLVVGTVAVLFTLHGSGSFAAVPDNAARALVAQLFVVIVAIVGLALALGRDEREALLRQLASEKNELAAQKEHAVQHGQLLTAIIDSMADGLAVIDAEGQVLLRNAAAEHLLGSSTSPNGRIAHSSHYGLLRTDGTPLADHDTVYARVIAGEQTVRDEMLVRRPDRPDGRFVTIVGTRLLDEHGNPRAVVLVHDVTAERRHRDDLAAFAGVVAHDLQNPLTAMRGWTENAADALQQVPAHPMAAQAESSLLRAQRAGTRMHTLIDDLLTYATARDGTIQPTTIDLNQLAAEIAAARADAATVAGTPVPRFVIDAPHAIHADPALTRQLLDNLLGNAVKYTDPAVTAKVSVRTSASADGQVQVTVTDNGIGIPAGQHDAIFGNFHRAHHDQAFTGTGLGLTICQRIVHRHGGTIIADDNPDGGSRFAFTMPSHDPATDTPAPAVAPRSATDDPASAGTPAAHHARRG